ncbi:hypothetical protein LIER_19405 [Lithospermum erythrorhizon]|uniref:Uncharacterized protein n=1 Tax=Lithospermum erythrorhizon TaxID=34254 RepID=A0AAV3QJ50_LITER
MKKTENKSGKDWPAKMEEALFGIPNYLQNRNPAKEGLAREDNMHLTLQELDLLDDQRLMAHQRLECYQSRISKAYDKKVKLMPKWDGLYVIQEVYPSGAYMMTDQEGKKIGPINDRYLKRYYPQTH